MSYPTHVLERRALIVLIALLESGAQADKPLQISASELSERARLSTKDLFFGLGQLLWAECLSYSVDNESFQSITVSLKIQNESNSVDSLSAPNHTFRNERNDRNGNINIYNIPNGTNERYDGNNIYNIPVTESVTDTEPLRREPRVIPQGEVVTLDAPERRAGEDSLSRDAASLAAALGESRLLAYYQSLLARYPPELISRALHDCLAVPDSAIRKNRAAFFKHLLNHYAKYAN